MGETSQFSRNTREVGNPEVRGLMELKRKSIGAGLAIGAGLGVALGMALHDIGVWLPIGVALGLVLSLTGKG
jgi:hypothetical protein